MKGFLKTLLSIVLLASVCFFTACDAWMTLGGAINSSNSSNMSQLSIPTNIRVDENMVLRWNTVDNAESYLVIINEDEYSRATPACDLKKIITKNGKYDIYVKAISGNALIENSQLSLVYVYDYNGEVITNENTQTGLFGQFDNVFTQAAYIGYGYDVINSSYVLSKEVKINYPIFDNEKLKTKKLLMINEFNSEDEYIKGNSIESYQSDFETKLSTKVKIGKAFSGSISSKFKTTSESTVSALFYEYRHTPSLYQLILQCDFEDYREMLTDSFKRDLMTLDYDTLFQYYGTHVITSAVMGGRFDLNYTMFSQKTIDTNSLSTSIETTLKYYNVDAGVDLSVEMKEKATEEDCSIDKKFVVVGGDTIDMSSEDVMFKNKQKWLTSIQEKPALVGIRDVNSLVGIWELLGDTPAEQARKTEMQEVFKKRGQDTYEEMLNNYKINSGKPVTESYWTSGEREHRVTDSNAGGFSEYWYTGLNRNALKAAGYTGFDITIKIKGKHVFTADWFHAQWYFQIYNNKGEKILEEKQNCWSMSDWSYREYVYTLDLDVIRDDGSILVKYSHEGDGHDDFYLNAVEVSIKAVSV